jgi:hypothetical protein
MARRCIIRRGVALLAAAAAAPAFAAAAAAPPLKPHIFFLLVDVSLVLHLPLPRTHVSTLPPRYLQCRPLSRRLPSCLVVCAHAGLQDLGHADVGFTEGPPSVEIVTPTLDRLVSEGVRLDRHYVHYVCTPTRSSIQSGRLPVHVTVALSNPDVATTGVPRNMTGMAQVLQRAGYATHYM